MASGKATSWASRNSMQTLAAGLLRFDALGAQDGTACMSGAMLGSRIGLILSSSRLNGRLRLG